MQQSSGQQHFLPHPFRVRRDRRMPRRGCAVGSIFETRVDPVIEAMLRELSESTDELKILAAGEMRV